MTITAARVNGANIVTYPILTPEVGLVAAADSHNAYGHALRFAAPTNGTSDARAAIANAATVVATAGDLVFDPGTYRIASNITLMCATRFLPGAVLKPDSGVTVTINGPVVASLAFAFDLSAGGHVVFGASAVAAVPIEWFWSLHNGVLDATSAVTAAIASVTASGGLVVGTGQTYPLSSVVSIPAGVGVRGISGQQATTFTSSVSSAAYAFTLGSTTAVALVYGTSLQDATIRLSSNSGRAVRAACTAGAVVRNVYIEGPPGASNASEGVFVDGGNVSNIFTVLDNVECNHVKRGFYVGTSGSTNATTVRSTGCSVNGDVGTGISSTGVQIDALSGDGNVFIGMDVEACAIGFDVFGKGTSFLGCRFEGNTVDIKLETGATGNTFAGCTGIVTITDVAGTGRYSNGFYGCRNATVTIPDSLPDGMNVNGIQWFPYPGDGGEVDILMRATNTGKAAMFVQAGGGSPSFGAGLALYGHVHAVHPGDIVAGISANSGGKFRINNSGVDGGADALRCDINGKIELRSGSDHGCGSVALASGSATVSNARVTASTLIMLSRQATSGTPGHLSVVAGSGTFTITSTSGSDAGTIAWMLLEPI